MTDAAPAKRQRVEGGERNLLVSRQDGARSSINVSAAEVGRESIASPAANQLSMWSAYCAGAAEPSLVDHYRHGGNEMEVKDVGGVEDVEEVAEEERAGPEPEWVTAPNEAQAAELEMLGLSIGVRLEVQWELELEGETHSVWWGCKLCGAYVRLPPGDAATAAAAGSQTEQSWRVLYDEKPEHGVYSLPTDCCCCFCFDDLRHVALQTYTFNRRLRRGSSARSIFQGVPTASRQGTAPIVSPYNLYHNASDRTCIVCRVHI
eukprot:SAG11_NODE_1002_length_6214_cov_2.976124_9_plen_262_part_00